MKLKFLFRQAERKVQRMRNMLAILALFICTSICVGLEIDGNTNVGRGRVDGKMCYYDIAGNSTGGNGILNGSRLTDPKGSTVTIKTRSKVGNVFGAYMNRVSLNSNLNRGFLSMTNNKVIVNSSGGRRSSNFHKGDIAGAWADDDIANLRNAHMNVSSNSVIIMGGVKIKDVYGGRACAKVGTVSSNTVTIGGVEDVIIGGSVNGGWVSTGTVSSNTVTITTGTIVTGCVNGGYIGENGTATLNKVNLTSVTVKGGVFGGWIRVDGYVSSNTVIIKGGKIKGEVNGGCIFENGTATLNEVHLTSVTVTEDVYGGWIGTDGLARDNKVRIDGNGKMEGGVYGGYIEEKGTATLNTVNLTSVTVSSDVYGARIGDGLASSNTVTITGGRVGKDVYGGYVSTGTASSNTVTINGGKTEGNVFGGCVGGNGKAIYNTITITGVTEFSTITILCGGICANKATADASTNDAFTGNTLNIVETKGVVVNGISNFEKYNFHLKDIKPGEVILTATSGGCSWDVVKKGYTTACKVDLSRSNIHLRTQSVLNKGEYCTLIKSPQGFKDNIACKQFSFDNGGLVEYSWEIKIADNKQDLIATLKRKELREGKAKPLLEGNVTGMVCINNGMDCIISKIEETESVLGEGAKLQRKGEIGAFYGLLANKSSYDDTGSHIDMTGMSMMGGIGIGWKGLVTGAFGEYGTGNSDIDSGLCTCEKKSEGTSKYVGGGLLGRYNVYEDEFRGTKLYLEAILRAGEVSNTFNIKEAKDGAEKECKYNDETTTYGGCALGGGCKHKVGEKMDVDWSLRYMFGYQDGKDVEKPVDVYGNRVKLESVKSSRIRVGVRGKYVELEKVKPYIGIWYEHELSGKVKGAIQNGVDNVGDIPATSFEGGTGIGELGVSVKVGKLDVGISGQGYLGVRKDLEGC